MYEKKNINQSKDNGSNINMCIFKTVTKADGHK